MTQVPDRWTAGATYEEFMGRWSTRLAPQFVSWMGVPAGSHWLDVGCGTGALTAAICGESDPASVTACDPAEPFIAYAQTRLAENPVTLHVAGSGSLPQRSGGYGCVASSLVLNFFPDPHAGVREMRTLTQPGGMVAACVWDYAKGMGFLRSFWDAAIELDGNARDLDEGRRFPLCSPQPLADLFLEAGLSEVQCEPLDCPTLFDSFDAYWRPFLGGTGPAPSYVASLSEEKRIRLRETLRTRLEGEPGEPIPLIARAWAVRGLA